MAKNLSLPIPSDGADGTATASPALWPALRAAYAAGRKTYGDFALEYEVFARETLGTVRTGLSRLGIEPTTEHVRDALDRAVGADLYLARACEADSGEAWACLCRIFEPRLRGVARRRGAGAAEADDLASLVLGQLATPPPSGSARTVLGTYSGAGSLYGWLSVILIRRKAAQARRPGSLPLDEQRDQPAQDGRGPGHRTPADPLQQVVDEESATRLQEALEHGWACLTPRERFALVLKYADGLKQRRVATLLGVGEPRVSRLVGQALKKLGSAVRRLGVEEDEGPRKQSLQIAIRESLASWAVRMPPASEHNRAGEAPHGT